MDKINRVYNVIILACVGALLLIGGNLFSSGHWIWASIDLIVAIFAALVLVASREEILQAILDEQVKVKIGIYQARYHSQAFEQFAGKEIIGLMLDSDKLFNAGPVATVNDYSYIVLPLAKAYEGLLKKILVDLGLLKENDLRNSPNVTVNRYFNPQGDLRVVDLLKDKARHKTIPYVVFATYQDCRNSICHYDPYSNNSISYEAAGFYRERIKDAMERSFDTFVPDQAIKKSKRKQTLI